MIRAPASWSLSRQIVITAAGIFLPLAYVRARDPHATVVIYPSDHFVYPEERFVESVRSAVRAAEKIKDRLVLLAAARTAPTPNSAGFCRGRVSTVPMDGPSVQSRLSSRSPGLKLQGGP